MAEKSILRIITSLLIAAAISCAALCTSCDKDGVPSDSSASTNAGNNVGGESADTSSTADFVATLPEPVSQANIFMIRLPDKWKNEDKGKNWNVGKRVEATYYVDDIVDIFDNQKWISDDSFGPSSDYDFNITVSRKASSLEENLKIENKTDESTTSSQGGKNPVKVPSANPGESSSESSETSVGKDEKYEVQYLVNVRDMTVYLHIIDSPANVSANCRLDDQSMKQLRVYLEYYFVTSDQSKS